MSGRAVAARLRAFLGDTLTLRALVALLASRVVVRTALSLAPLVVRPAWTKAEFAAYAAAMARFVFVVPVLSGGVEKSVLKMLPRARRAAPALVALYLVMLGALVTGIAAWITLSAVTASATRLVVLAGTLAVLLGINQVVVAIHRAAGRVWLDLADQAVVFALLCIGLASALWWDAGPEQLLATWVVLLSALNALTAVALMRWSAPRRHGSRRLVRLVGRDVAFQGSTDVVTGLSVALLLGAVAVAGDPDELTSLYVVLSITTIVTTGYTYVMRVLQPSIARRRRNRPVVPSTLAPRLCRPGTVVLAGAWGAVVLVVGRWAIATDQPPGPTWWLLAAFAAYVPLLTTVAGLHFVFENSDHESLRTTARAAALGFVALGVTVVPLVAWAGAMGALAAIAVGELVHLALLVRAMNDDRVAPAVRLIAAAR